jgi:hypothetical protein
MSRKWCPDACNLEKALNTWIHKAHLVATYVDSHRDLPGIIPPLPSDVLGRDNETYLYRPPVEQRPGRKRTKRFQRRRKVGPGQGGPARGESVPVLQNDTASPPHRQAASVCEGNEDVEETSESDNSEVDEGDDVGVLRDHNVPEGFKVVQRCPRMAPYALVGTFILHAFTKVQGQGTPGWFLGQVSSDIVDAGQARRNAELSHTVKYDRTFPRKDGAQGFRTAYVPHALTSDRYGPDQWWVIVEEIQ